LKQLLEGFAAPMEVMTMQLADVQEKQDQIKEKADQILSGQDEIRLGKTISRSSI